MFTQTLLQAMVIQAFNRKGGLIHNQNLVNKKLAALVPALAPDLFLLGKTK